MARESFGGLAVTTGCSTSTSRGKVGRHWWQQAEALVGYFNAWELSGDTEFAEKAFGSWEFIWQYLVDRETLP